MQTYTNGHSAQDAASSVLPNDARAEKAVIGSALLDSDAYSAAAATGLTAKSFHDARHRAIWQALEYLAARSEPTSDLVLVENELAAAGDLDTAGGLSYLLECVTETTSSAYAEHYAGIVLSKATKRKIIMAGSTMVRLGYESGDDDPADILDRASQTLIELSAETSSGLRQARAYLGDVMDSIEAGPLAGVNTGYGHLDQIVGGMLPGNLVILAGRPAMGKSALAQNFVENVCKHGGTVAFFSLEMSNDDLMKRIISSTTAIPLTRIRRGGDHIYDDEWPVLMAAAAVINDYDLWLLDRPMVSISQLRGMARALKRSAGKLDLIVIDYLQLLGGGSGRAEENRQQEVSYISRSLKVLARELDVPVLALSQLSRAVESRADKRPMLSDLRESGSLEQDADVVMFVYREDYYVEDTDRQNIADAIVAKNRSGETGTASLFFRKECAQFRSLEVTRETLTY